MKAREPDKTKRLIVIHEYDKKTKNLKKTATDKNGIPVESDNFRQFILVTNIPKEKEISSAELTNILKYNLVNHEDIWDVTHDILSIKGKFYRGSDAIFDYTKERYDLYSLDGKRDPILHIDWNLVDVVSVYKTDKKTKKYEKFFAYRFHNKNLQHIILYFCMKNNLYEFNSPSLIKKPKPPKKPTSHEERLAEYNDRMITAGRTIPLSKKKKVRKPKEERDHVSANKPKPYKDPKGKRKKALPIVKATMPTKKEKKPKSLPTPPYPLNNSKRHVYRQKFVPKTYVCIKDDEKKKVLRLPKEKANKMVDGNPTRFKFTTKQEWKAQQKLVRKGEWKSGMQHNTTFENRMSRMEILTKRNEAVAKNVAGHMQRLNKQKVTFIVPSESKRKSFKTRIHVWVPSFYEFDKRTGKSLEDRLDKAKTARRPNMDRINRIQSMIDKGYSKAKPWSAENPIGYVGDPIKRIKKVRKVLLEKEVFYYDYVKPETTITKTIIHKSAYTDSTSTTTSERKLKSTKPRRFGQTSPRKPNHKMRTKHAHYRTGETRIPLSKQKKK